MNEHNCKIVIDLFYSDQEKEAMEMMMKLLDSYKQKYDIKDEELFEKDFRKDTKLIFHVLHNGLASEKMVKELEEEFDDSEADRKDKKEYMDFVDNIHFVLQKIDTVDLRNPDDEFTNHCSNAMSFLYQKQQDMVGLTNTMKELTFRLEKIEDAFKNTKIEINDDYE